MGQSWGELRIFDYRNNKRAEERRLMLVTPLVCTCAGFTPGGSLRKKRPSLSRPVPCPVVRDAVALDRLERSPWRLPLDLCRPDAGPGPTTRRKNLYSIYDTVESSCGLCQAVL